MIAFSRVRTFTVRLPAGDKSDSLLHIVIYIRDYLDCVREVTMSPMIVSIDSVQINHFIDNFQTSSGTMNSNPLVQLLSSENQNVVGQILISLSQQFNRMNDENVGTAVSSKSSHVFLMKLFFYSSFFRWNTDCKYFRTFIRKSKFN